MNFFAAIRWRLQLWYGLLLFTVLCGFGIAVYQLENGRQARRLDEELQQRLPLLVESQHPVRAGEGQLRAFTISARNAALFDRGGDGSCYYVVWLHHSQTPVIYSATAPPDVPLPRAGAPTVRQRGQLREAFLFPGPNDCVLVGRSVAAETAGLRQLAWRLAGIGLAVLLLGLAMGAWLVARALRPIHEISVTAGKISTGDLTQRIPVENTGSELSQLAAVLNSTFARLDAAFAQQARFTADAAHELRTPVTVMLTHLQNGLASGCENPEHREAFEASQRAAQRMRRLIESLLELARLDSGQESLQRNSLDLAETVADVLKLLLPLAAGQVITIKSDLAATPCRADGDRLTLVITNLLTNAIHHNHRGGEVWVSTRLAGGMAILTVSDNGPGISVEHLPHIFDRFYRVDSARIAGQGRTGLGLAITKAIVQAHAGTIEVASEAGCGTTFTVRLPE